MAKRIALGLLLLGPVVIIPGGLDRFVFGKLAAVAAGAAVAALTARSGRLPRHVWLLLAAAAAVLAVAATGPGFWASFWGRAPRYEGAAVLAVYVAAAAAGARLLSASSSSAAQQRAVRLLAVASALTAALAVAEAFGLRPLETTLDRPGSLFGNASDQGAFGVLAAGILGAAALRAADRWNVGGVACAGIAVALSGSRGAVAGLAVVAVILSIVYRTLAAAGAFTLVAALALLVPGTGSRLLGHSPLAAQTAAGRLDLWRETGDLLREHPWVGVGPSRFGDAITVVHTAGWYRATGTQAPVDSPHDWLLQALSAGGPALLVLAIAVAVLVALRRGPAGYLAALAGYGTVLLVHVTSPGPACLAAVLGGAVLARPATGPPVRPWALAGGVLAGALLLAGFAEVPLRSAILDVSRGGTGAAGFSAARTLRPWDTELDVIAGHALAVAGRTEAGPYLRRAASALPASAPVLADLASVAEIRQRYAEAAGLLARARRLDPHNPQLMLRTGVVQAEQRQFRAAERSFLTVSRMDPRSPEPWDDLTVLYRIQNRTADADRASTRSGQLRGRR